MQTPITVANWIPGLTTDGEAAPVGDSEGGPVEVEVEVTTIVFLE